MRNINKMQILREVEKNMTYQSIRFNNKQISDEIIKATIDEYFPKIFPNQKLRDLTFFTKAMKDQEFYSKIRTLVSTQLSLEQHLDEIEQRQIEKSKIQDFSSSHGVQELNNNKKMTRAALAKRNQQTQQQLRKDQIYVRLTPKTQQSLKWMLCNRKFPRIECKYVLCLLNRLSCNQHIEYLVNYLSNKWLSSNKGNNRIVLYPDVGSFLKNNLSAKERQKILKEPLNNFFMFTDVMIGSGIGQNGILNLHYEILQKKKDIGSTGANGSNNLNAISESRYNNNGSIMDSSLGYMQRSEKKHAGYINSNGEMIQTDSYHKVTNYEQQSNNNKKTVNQRQDDINNNNRIIGQEYVPVSAASMINKQLNTNNAGNMKQNAANTNNRHGPSNANQSQLNNPHNQSSLLMHNPHYSNHFLSNQSNLLNPNRSIYHDQQSIFKSIGFSAFGGGNNTYGFQKKNEFHLLTVNSNSYLDVGIMNQIKEREKEKQQEREKEKQLDKPKGSKESQGGDLIILEQKQANSQKSNKQKQQSINISKKVQTKLQQNQQKQKSQIFKGSSPSPRNVKVIKPIASSPKKQIVPNNKQKQIQKEKQVSLQQVSQIKEESMHDVKKHQEKLLDLRNAINLLQEEGFNQVKNEEISQKQLKQVKTVSIKKKLAN